jgi:hypothetical protein
MDIIHEDDMLTLLTWNTRSIKNKLTLLLQETDGLPTHQLLWNVRRVSSNEWRKASNTNQNLQLPLSFTNLSGGNALILTEMVAYHDTYYRLDFKS